MYVLDLVELLLDFGDSRELWLTASRWSGEAKNRIILMKFAIIGYPWSESSMVPIFTFSINGINRGTRKHMLSKEHAGMCTWWQFKFLLYFYSRAYPGLILGVVVVHLILEFLLASALESFVTGFHTCRGSVIHSTPGRYRELFYPRQTNYLVFSE